MSAIGIEKDNFEKICKAISSIKATIDNNEFNSEAKLDKIKVEAKIIEDNL